MIKYFIIVPERFISCSVIQYGLNDLLIFMFRKKLDGPLYLSLISSMLVHASQHLHTVEALSHMEWCGQQAAEGTVGQANH